MRGGGEEEERIARALLLLEAGGRHLLLRRVCGDVPLESTARTQAEASTIRAIVDFYEINQERAK